MKKSSHTWTEPKNKDPFKQALDKNLPPEIKRPDSQFKETKEDEKPADARDVKRQANNELDRLTIALGQKHYISKPRFAWLVEHVSGINYPLTVDRFYEPLKLLIDARVDKSDDKHMKLKQELCAKNGFQYFHIKTEDNLQNMLAKVRAH